MSLTNLQIHTGSLDGFFTLLRQSQLLEWTEVEALTAAAARERTGRTADGLAAWLVERGTLTRFQADKLLAGKPNDLVAGPYLLREIIGTGGMGPVYRATRRPDGGDFTIKLVPRRNMGKVVKARRYVRAFEKVTHPAVARFVDVGTHWNHHYFAWSFVEGESLRARVEREGPLPPAEAARFAAEAADALAACHEHGLTHGMLSPANLLVGPDGKARVLDAGIGSLTTTDVIHTFGQADQIFRGLDCASPEAVLDPERVTAASDQYGLGCMLYFLLTGRYPFEGGAVVKMQAHQTETPTPVDAINPFVPRGLAAIIERLLRKEPTERFPWMADVAEALRTFAEHPPVKRASVVVRTPMPEPLAKLETTPTRPVDLELPSETQPANQPFGEPEKERLGVATLALAAVAVLVWGVVFGLVAAWGLK